MAWLSFDKWLIIAVATGYFCLLFLVAYWAQNTRHQRWVSNPIIYSLSLGVSCTAWAFYGVIGQTATSGALLSPIYIGTIASMVLLWPMLLKVVRINKQLNLSSIADLLASRYVKLPYIAPVVTAISLVAMIPYIALQLRAVSQSFNLVTGSVNGNVITTLVVTLMLIIFSILFGARTATINRQNPGLVFAIAFSSLVKLLALSALGLYVTFFLFDGVNEIMLHAPAPPPSDTSHRYSSLAQAVLGALTVFTLPALFHMIVVENHHESELRTARWLYPLFLIAINLFVLPIATAGLITFPGDSINADTYALSLPMYFHQTWLTLGIFVGGIAAALSMVIVATVVLSNMVITDFVTPMSVKSRIGETSVTSNFAHQLLLRRRVTIAVLLIFAMGFERGIEQDNHLANIGLLAFVLISQLGPAFIAALYWSKASSLGALFGMLSGAAVWAYCLLLPVLSPTLALMQSGLFNIEWLSPLNFLGLGFLGDYTSGIFASLLVNVSVFTVTSLLTIKQDNETQRFFRFIEQIEPRREYSLSYQQLIDLFMRFGDEYALENFTKRLPTAVNLQQYASSEWLDYTERALASVLGSATARLTMRAASEAQTGETVIEEVADMVNEASQLLTFNRELLTAALENIEQGIAVVDKNMCLVAWNKRYVELLEYPEHYLNVGIPVEHLLRYNASRQLFQDSDIEGAISKRVEYMKQGQHHIHSRTLPSGKVIEIRGQAMPGGGFVSTYTDISEHIAAQKALESVNERLEQRVIERTAELEHAKTLAESANRSKTRFLAAASHDLMQPFNALSLYTDMLYQKLNGGPLEPLSCQIRTSLEYVESLLKDLVEISKLDGQALSIVTNPISLDHILRPLVDEVSLIAQQKGVELRYVACHRTIDTEPKLLRRIVQNLLTNAIQYAADKSQAKVIIVARRRGNYINIQVWDNGPGIPADKQALIFQEFERLAGNTHVPGLGLGLAICDRIAKVLNTQITLNSQYGKGAVFGVRVPLSDQAPAPYETMQSSAADKQRDALLHLHVIIVDNDALSLRALQSLLEQWECRVEAFASDEALRNRPLSEGRPELIICDYHLGHDVNGVALTTEFVNQYPAPPKIIICSADNAESVRQQCIDHAYAFIRKPVKALALKRIIKTVVQ